MFSIIILLKGGSQFIIVLFLVIGIAVIAAYYFSTKATVTRALRKSGVIDTTKTISYLIPDANYTSGTFKDATPEMEEFLSRHNFKSTGPFGFNKTLRYKEGVLEKDELCSVTGEGQWNETKDHNLQLPAKQVLVITAQEGKQVFLSDDPVTIEEPI